MVSPHTVVKVNCHRVECVGIERVIGKVILKEGWPFIWAHRVKASNQGNYSQAYRCDITYAWLAQ